MSALDLSRRAALTGATASGLALPAFAQVRRGGTLVVALDPEPIALASAGSIDAGASVVSPKLFDRLFNQDLQGRPVPQLALSGKVSPDGLAVTINLRPGVKWHDGQPLTSADVAYSITDVWARYNARIRLAFANLERVDTPSPLTVVIRLNKPAPYVFSALADGGAQVVPRHIYAGKDVLSNPNNRAPVGSGPFIFESWERGSSIVLRRNTTYWDLGKPYLDKIVFRLIPAGAPTVAALETGSVHYVGQSQGVPLSEVDRLRVNKTLWVVSRSPSFLANFSGLAFNVERPVFRDIRVRQAFAHAIDKAFIIKNVWMGHGVEADSPIPPNSPFHAASLPQYPLDLHKAEALLDAAGYRGGPDGVRLTLHNDIMPPSTLNNLAAEFIRSSLGKIGVKLELRREELGAYLKRIFGTHDFDTETYGTATDFDPALGIQRFYWSKSIQPGVPYTNPTHYASPEIDRLLEAAQVELDPGKRRELYAEVQRVVQRDLPLIPILFPDELFFGNRRLNHPFQTRVDNLADASLVA